MALLETMTAEEAIKHGVTVCPHVAEPKAQPLDMWRGKLPAYVPSWAKWVAADSYGHVFAYTPERPAVGDGTKWVTARGSYCVHIGTIDMHGIDWRQTLTPVPAQHSDFMQAHIAAEVAEIDAQPQTWCEKCNLPDDICRGHDDAIPADVAAALTAQHSAEWCERLCEELLTLLPSALAWQLSTLDGAGIAALARQLAQADSTKASLIAETLWSEAMDVEHAQLQADDAALEDSNRRAVEAAPVANYSIGDRVFACGHPAAIVAVHAHIGVYTVKFDAPQTWGALVPFTTCLLSDEQLQPNNITDDEWDTIAGMAGA